MPKPMLQIYNFSSPMMGEPPEIDNRDPNLYVSYFEDVVGGQWVFTHNFETRKSVLRSGEPGWDT